MSTLQHTPGPWSQTAAVTLPDDAHFVIEGKNGWFQVAITCGELEQGLQEEEANANLIAAAPELLEKLRVLADVASESVELSDWPELIKAIDDAQTIFERLEA